MRNNNKPTLVERIKGSVKNKKAEQIKVSTEDEKNLAVLQEAKEEIAVILDKYKIQLGIWLVKKDIDALCETFTKHPGIQSYKLEAQLRKG